MREYSQDKDACLRRLRCIEGQVRRIARVVDEDGDEGAESVRAPAAGITKLVRSGVALVNQANPDSTGVRGERGGEG